jgi:hypothetical protein
MNLFHAFAVPADVSPAVDSCPTTLQTRVDGVLLAAQIALVACVAAVAVILVMLLTQRVRRQSVSAR